MNTREALQELNRIGIPIALVAKRIKKDPSTIQKWLRGTSKYLAKDTEDALKLEILNIVNQIKEIKVI